MTKKEKALLAFAQYENVSNDPEQERLNILRYQNFGGPLASNVDKDAMAAEYLQELIDAVARAGNE